MVIKGVSNVDQALFLALGYLKDMDEDAKKRLVIKGPLTKRQLEHYKRIIRKNREAHLFPVQKYYIRTNRKNGKKYLILSRRDARLAEDITKNVFAKDPSGKLNAEGEIKVGYGPYIGNKSALGKGKSII